MNSNKENKVLSSLLILCFTIAVIVFVILIIPKKESQDIKDIQTIYVESIPRESKLTDIKFEDKVNIYFFWGDGCPHCEDFFAFLDEVNKEYGKYFKVYAFEVWNNKTNAEIMDSFKKELNGKVGKYSVPYIIIGDEVVEGFIPSMKEEILNIILNKYENLDEINHFENIIK